MAILFSDMKQNSKRFEFKVIAGSLKGKMIYAPDLGVTRPPLSRLRKSIFDFLNPYLRESAYLDLFSGTGSYLFEAVSRGVKSANGVELEPKLSDSINNQADKYNVSDRLKCYTADVLKIVPEFCERKNVFDIIMIAPPQYRSIIDETLKVLKDNPVYHKDSLILCQHDTSEREINFLDFEIFQKRKYGNTTYTILKVD